MAIKGKGRTRSGRRVITAPPRPQLVVRKPPIWRRRWVWAVTAVLAAAGITIPVLVSLHHKHQRAFKNREIAAVEALSQQVASKLPPGTQSVQPDLLVFYPTLTQDLDNLASGKLKTADANKKVTQIQTTAAAAQQGIQNISVANIIPADFTVTTLPGATAKGLTRQQLIQAQSLMAEAFQLYQNVASLTSSAVTSSGRDRAAFIDQAKSIYTQAGTIFDRGYRMILDMRQALGITGSFPSPPPGTG